MKILDRYLMRSFAVPFITCVFLFGLTFIVVDLFSHLDEILKYSLTPSFLAKYYAAFYPITFVETSPMALLLAALYSLGILNKRHEIRAMRSSGLGLVQLLGPYLFVGLCVSVASFIINETVVPKMVGKVALLEESFGPPQGKQKDILENVALFGKDHRLYYAEQYDPQKKELKNLIILEDSPDYRPVSKIQSRKARWVHDHWILFDGFTMQLDPQGKLLGEPDYFKGKRLESFVQPGDFLKTKHHTETMTYRELRRHLYRLKGRASPSLLTRLRVDLYRKIAFPFSNLIILLVGVPFVLTEGKRAGALRGIAISLVLSFIFYTASAIGSALGKGGILPPVLSVWLANIVFGIVGLILLRRVV